MHHARRLAGLMLLTMLGCGDPGRQVVEDAAPVAYLVRDVNPGSTSAYPQRLASLGGQLLFVADDGAHGFELWSSDGSHAGTQLVRDLGVGAQGAGPSPLVAFGNALYFSSGAQAPTGSEPWRTDGTFEGTRLVQDIVPGQGSSYPTDAVELGGLVLFRTLDPSVGTRHLWRSDGTSAGTQPLSSERVVGPQALLGSLLYYFVDVQRPGQAPIRRALWRSDGTPAGTAPVALLPEGVFPQRMLAATGRLFFLTLSADDYALWTSDGSEAGTLALVGRLIQRPRTPVYELATLGERALFSAHDPAGTVSTLWVSDGTPAGTHELPGAGGTPVPVPTLLRTVGTRVFFRAGVGLSSLWVSDGTPAGTRELAVGINPTEFVAHAGQVYFQGWDAGHGTELWRSDGTPEGTARVTDVAPGPDGSRPFSLRSVGSRLFFVATTSTVGEELWAYGIEPRGQPKPPTPPAAASVNNPGPTIGSVAVNTNNGRVVPRRPAPRASTQMRAALPPPAARLRACACPS